MAEATLPGGFWQGGRSYREAALRPLTGADELHLIETGRDLLPAERATGLLARCVERLGPLTGPGPAEIRALAVGDREALLLQLRRLTFGNELECRLACPSGDCGEELEITLAVGALLVAPYSTWRQSYESTLAGSDGRYAVRFRLPTGGDQESVSGLACADPAAAERRLLERCVEEVRNGRPAAASLPPADWPSCVAAQVPELLAERDPQAELSIAMTCPACGDRFVALLDAGETLYRELAARSAGLYRQIHLLALHYHWSEAEILALTPARREVYLGLLADSLDGVSPA